MTEEHKYCAKILEKHFNKKLKMTKDDEETFKNERFCHICNKKYLKGYKEQTKDHDHYTGKYMGCAHSICNKGFYYEKRLNVFFHNLRGYDSHFLIQEIGKFDKKVSVIPNNSEKFLSFSVGGVIFKDSYQFMQESLEKLTENLVKK